MSSFQLGVPPVQNVQFNQNILSNTFQPNHGFTCPTDKEIALSEIIGSFSTCQYEINSNDSGKCSMVKTLYNNAVNDILNSNTGINNTISNIIQSTILDESMIQINKYCN